MTEKGKNPDHISMGSKGEEIAIRHLIRNRFSVIDRNFRTKYGEIDIVARSFDGTLTFIEVKTMSTGGELLPEDQYSASKRQKTERICMAYANGNPRLIQEERGWRMDLIAIRMPRDLAGEKDLTKIEKSCEIKYYENV